MTDFRTRLLRAYDRSPYRSQAALASAAGVSQRTVEKILSGEHRRPYIPTARALARALGVTVRSLYDPEDA